MVKWAFSAILPLMVVMFSCAGGGAGGGTEDPDIEVPGFFEKTTNTIIGVDYGSLLLAEIDSSPGIDLIVTGRDNDDVFQAVLFFNDGSGIFTEAASDLIPTKHGELAGADIDDDSDIDVLLTGRDSSGIARAELFINQSGVLSLSSDTGLAGTQKGKDLFGDFNNDGSPDILTIGLDTVLYLNDGSGCFTELEQDMVMLNDASGCTGDIDGDGDLDCLVSGDELGTYVSVLFLNDGDGAFSDSGVDIPGVIEGASALEDVDGDGDLDIFISGTDESGSEISRLYRNGGGLVFALQPETLVGVTNGTANFADFDNDGDLDLILTGSYDNGEQIEVANLYINDGGGDFIQVESGLTPVHHSSCAVGDIDGDGDLDIVLNGSTGGSGYITEVYSNALF